MKRKTMTLVLCLLAALALVSVGFASWVISADAKGETEGQITVDTVVDNRLTVDISFKDNVKEFRFGAPETMNNSNAWLKNDSEDKEKLTVVLNVKVTKDASNTISASDLKSKIKVTEFASTLFEATYAETTKKYINKTEPLVSDVTVDSSNPNIFNFTITLQLKWGNVFADGAEATEGDNPYIYYNGKTDEEAAETAKQTLQAFNEAAKNAKFTVKLTISK